MDPKCLQLPLAEILSSQCDHVTEVEVQRHLEDCKACQQRLAELAADAPTWANTARHLSTIRELRLSPAEEHGLSQASSFVVPTSEFSRQTHGSTQQDHPSRRRDEQPIADWMRLLDPPRHPEMQGRIDQFDVDACLGRGGMGIVLKGHDRELDRSVAIKVLAPHLASHGTARKRFAREAQAAAAVVHPNVVPIYSVNQSPDRPYLVMQLVSGHSLQSLVDQKGPLEPFELVRIAIQIADGLAAAHHQGLIHRDVKPANVLTERDASRVMITDFGLARAADDAGLTQTGWLAGTPHYMSPEQARGDDLDPRSDLFSLGALMYFLATGREPFRAETPFGVIQKIIHEQTTQVRSLAPEVPLVVAQVINKLLEKDADNRFNSADQLATYLRDLLAHLQHPDQAKAPTKIQTSSDRVRRKKRTIAGIGATALFLAAAYGATWIAGQPADPQPNLENQATAGEATAPAVADGQLDDAKYLQELNEAESQLQQLEQLFAGDQVFFSEPDSLAEPDSSILDNQPLMKGIQNDDP